MNNNLSIIKPNQIIIDRYIRINREQYMFFLQIMPDCDIYDYEIYNQDQILRKGRNIFQIKNNGKQYHYLLISRGHNYFLKFHFYRILSAKNNEIQLIDEKFLFINVKQWIKENKHSVESSSSVAKIPKPNVSLEIQSIKPTYDDHPVPIENLGSGEGDDGEDDEEEEDEETVGHMIGDTDAQIDPQYLEGMNNFH
jgi:hypothetical protein